MDGHMQWRISMCICIGTNVYISCIFLVTDGMALYPIYMTNIYIYIYICHPLFPNVIALIHSDHFNSSSSSPLYNSDAILTQYEYLPEYHADVPQSTCPRSLYVATREGLKPTTLRLKVIDLTNTPPRPTWWLNL